MRDAFSTALVDLAKDDLYVHLYYTDANEHHLKPKYLQF